MKTNLILTLHKIFSFDKVLQSYNLIQFIHPRLDLVNPNLVNYHDLVNKYQLQNYFTIANSIWFSKLQNLVNQIGVKVSFVKSRLVCIESFVFYRAWF